MVASRANTVRGLLCVSLLSDHSMGPPLPVLNTPGAASSALPRHPSVCALLRLKEPEKTLAAGVQVSDVDPHLVYLVCASLLH